MNKKLITLAIAAAMAAPAAAMADATLYGRAHVSIDYVDVDQFANWGKVPAPNGTSLDLPGAVLVGNVAYLGALDEGYTPLQAAVIANNAAGLAAGSVKYSGWGLNMNNRNSRVGVKGSEDLGNGLKAIYQIEFGVDISNDNRDTNIADGNRKDSPVQMRNSFVGLAGNWGTLLMGRHDTPAKISTAKLDLFSDTLADYNYTVGFADVRADNTVAYISPSFAGLQFAGAIIPSGGATAGFGVNTSNTSIASAYSLALIYSNGPFYGSASYENLGDKYWANDNAFYRAAYGRDSKAWDYWKFGLGLLDWNGFTLDGVYEIHSNVMGAPHDANMDLWQVQAGYAFGNNMIKGMYGQSSVDQCADPFGQGYVLTCSYVVGDLLPINLNNQNISTWAVGFDHNFSKRTTAYLLYTQTDSDQSNANWSGFSLGMIHSF